MDHEIGLGRTAVDARLKVTLTASSLAASGETPWDSVSADLSFLLLSLLLSLIMKPEVTIGARRIVLWCNGGRIW